MKYLCSECNQTYPLLTYNYQCDCGGLFQLLKEADDNFNPTISLGEAQTPIIKRRIGNHEMFLKLDYYMPTGSFKDRGAYVLINYLQQLGVNEVIEDSSGNAGASIAAYCAAAGIKCHIYLPEGTSEGKIRQIAAYGAHITKVPGARDATSEATLEQANQMIYASHVYNPLFFEGTKSLAYEIVEQIGIPDYVVVPVGNGTMLLGLYKGFKELGRLPKLIGVQTEACCPVYTKFKEIQDAPVQSTLAEGIAVGKPVRINEMIEAIKESKGDMVIVDEIAICRQWENMAKMGVYIEPTSASIPAGAITYFQDKILPENVKIVVPLTGIGLKKT